MATPPNTPSDNRQRNDDYLKRLEEARRRMDMSNERLALRETMDRIEKMADDVAKSVKKQNPAENATSNPKVVNAFKKMLEETIESIEPNTRQALKSAKNTLEAANEIIEQAEELNASERAFLRKMSEDIGKEIDGRSNAWTRGISALGKSFSRLDTDMQSLLVGATTKSPILMMMTKLMLTSNKEKQEQALKLQQADFDRRIELANARKQALTDMEDFVQDPTGTKRKGGGRRRKTAAQPEEETPHTAFPDQDQAPKRSATAATPTPRAAAVPVEGVGPDGITDRDAARDNAIEEWMKANPGKDLDESPFAQQDKRWAQPRPVQVTDEAQVTDEPVKEAIEELTTVVAAQSEPIRESLHADEETNDLLHHILASGKQLAEDMEMRDEEADSEVDDAPTHVKDSASTLAPVAASKSGESGEGGGFLSSLFSMDTVITMLGLKGLKSLFTGGIGKSIVNSVKAIASGLSRMLGNGGFMTIIRTLGAGLLRIGTSLLIPLSVVGAKLLLAFGAGYLIGKAIQFVADKLFGIDITQMVSDGIQKMVSKVAMDKQEQLNAPYLSAAADRLRKEQGFVGTDEEVLAQGKAHWEKVAARRNRAEQKAREIAGGGAYTPQQEAVVSGGDLLPQTGVMSPYGQMINADTTHGSDQMTPLASSVASRPVHATTPQAVARVASGVPGSKRMAGDWTISKAGLELVKKEEGFIEKPKWDVNGYTVGYGMHEWQGQKVDDILKRNPNFRVTRAQADAELERQLHGRYRAAVAKGVKTPITQNEFDGLVSVAWNLGSVPRNLRDKINRGEQVTVADFQKSGTVGGKIHSGLQRRRASEFAMFTGSGDHQPVSHVASLVAPVPTTAGRVASTGKLVQNSTQSRQQSNILIAPTVNAPQTNVASGGSQPTVMAVPTARNTEPSLNALTRLQNGA